jgi:alkylation response protein AidB-like acyl-CoA dehydrogenase
LVVRRELCEAVAWLAPRFNARAAGYDRSGEFPVDDFEDLRTAGLLGLMVPTRLGGFGAGFAEYAGVAYELARGSGPTALVFNMHASVTGALAGISDQVAAAVGVPDEFLAARDEILSGAAGGACYAVAMSERGAGSRLSQLSTVYGREDGGFRIKGAKSFVSGAGHAAAYLVAARSGGVEGLALWFAQLMPHWMVASYAAVYAGVARAAIDAAVEHLNARGLAGLPSARARIGHADATVAATLLAVGEAARRVDEAPGDPETNRWVWRAKLLAGTTAADVAASVLEAAGTSATRRGHPLERLYRDARCGSLQPATSDVCADWLGVAALGGDPDSDGGTPRW